MANSNTARTAAALKVGDFVTRTRRTALGTKVDKVMVTGLKPHKWAHTPDGVWIRVAYSKATLWVPLTHTGDIAWSRTTTISL